jgi:hypothetical protein
VNLVGPELNQEKIIAELFATLIKETVKAAGASVGQVFHKLIEAFQKDLRQ